MMESMKKAILTGIGALSLSKQKVEEIVDELVSKGELSRKQGKKVVDELMNAGKREQEAIAEQVSKMVSDMLDRMDVATKDDLAKLEKRVAKLEKGE